MRQVKTITVASGDGVGPEIMGAVLEILRAARAPLAFEQVDLGESVWRRGVTSGVPLEAWESLRRTGVLLKGPIATPQGGGMKSVNVTLRKTLGLFANVRPCVAYAPFVATRHPFMDVVVVRENEEDLYAGIEHQQTQDVRQCLKLITRPGTERLVRYAFAYARANNRRRVTCITKDNIMKMTDGLFRQVFEEIAAEHPELKCDHMIVDAGAARLADQPEQFDVIVTPNLYGDILSDIAAEVAGSIGLAPSANIGASCAMFEAIHGSAPDIAGKGVANPSGLLLAAVMMLVHVGQPRIAASIHNAWLKTIEDGLHTRDIWSSDGSHHKLGTQAFADAVIARLGEEPVRLAPVLYAGARIEIPELAPRVAQKKETVGVDVFVDWDGAAPQTLAERLQPLGGDAFALNMITNRGVKVWPEGMPETFLTDHWRCRFMSMDGPLDGVTVAELVRRAAAEGVDVIKTETLRTFDGKPGYSMGQGQ